MADNPLVSVIIPVYNVEPYLRQCLDSVVNQTYKNLDILVIDDGSTDGCGAICDEFGAVDNRVSVFHTENRGLSAARNLGLDEARGDYISLIDSDDWFELDAIEIAMRAAIENGTDIVCFWYVQEYKSTSHNIKGYNIQKPILLCEEEIIEAFCKKEYIDSLAWNKVYKKKLFSEIRYPEGRFYEDVATTYQLLIQSKKVACIGNTLTHYRARKGSISSSHSYNNLKDHWWASKKCYEDFRSISEDYGYLQIERCVYSIGRTWRWYFGLSKKEQVMAKGLLNSMQIFASDHRKEVLSNSSISIENKMFCLCSFTTNPFVMASLFVSNIILRRLESACWWKFKWTV